MMADELTTIIGGITIGIIILVIIMLFISWIILRKIRKKAPKFENLEDLKNVNYDPAIIERRELQNADTERRTGSTEEKAGGNGSGKDKNIFSGSGISPDEEIRRIREEIRRREEELGLTE